MIFPEKKIYQFLGALLLILSSLSVSAQNSKEPEITANVVSRRLNMGETGTLVIKITNGDATDLPARIDVPGLDVIKAGGGVFSKVIINGAMNSQNVHYYQLRPTMPGRFTIPAITTKIEGKDYSTKAIEITVVRPKFNDLAAQATQPFFGRFNIDTKEVYTNQLVPFDITVFARGRNSISDVTSAKLKHESFVIKNFSEVKLDAIEISGNLYSFARLPANLFALKPGDHTLGPCSVVISVVSSKPSFGPFSFQQVARQRILTDVAKITVKPLPAGAPASFTGGVGNFKFTGAPSTTSLSVGDPISMNFEVTGVGNLGTLGAPLFSNADNIGLWKTYDSSKSLEPEDASDGVTSGKCTFSQVIIPLKETKEIPPFELTFFDPEKEQYVTRRTQAIPITVAPASEQGTTTAATFSGNKNMITPDGSTYPAASNPTAEYPDVLYIRTGKPKWQSYTAIVPGSRGGTFFYIFHFICSLGFFTLLGFGIARWVRERKLQQAKSLLTFEQSLKSIQKKRTSKRDFYHAVSISLDLWKQEHRNAPQKVVQAIDKVNDKCNARLYAGKDATDGPIRDSEATEFLAVLKKLPTK